MQGGDTPAVVEPGLPAVKGQMTANLTSQTTSISSDGCITTTQASNSWTYGANGSGYMLRTLTVDASRSSNIFGNSDTVQPPALVLIPQIRF